MNKSIATTEAEAEACMMIARALTGCRLWLLSALDAMIVQVSVVNSPDGNTSRELCCRESKPEP